MRDHPFEETAPQDRLGMSRFHDPDRIESNRIIPLPLPPAPSTPGLAVASSSNSVAPSASLINFSELERLNRISSGAGSTFYKERHRPSGGFYALKVIYGNYGNAGRLQIFWEIEIFRGIDNPKIVVKCFDMFNHNGEIQVLVDRGSLEGTRIADECALAHLSCQILVGLAYLHTRKIVHRDIKPSN